MAGRGSHFEQPRAEQIAAARDRLPELTLNAAVALFVGWRAQVGSALHAAEAASGKPSAALRRSEQHLVLVYAYLPPDVRAEIENTLASAIEAGLDSLGSGTQQSDQVTARVATVGSLRGRTGHPIFSDLTEDDVVTFVLEALRVEFTPEHERDDAPRRRTTRDVIDGNAGLRLADRLSLQILITAEALFEEYRSRRWMQRSGQPRADLRTFDTGSGSVVFDPVRTAFALLPVFVQRGFLDEASAMVDALHSKKMPSTISGANTAAISKAMTRLRSDIGGNRAVLFGYPNPALNGRDAAQVAIQVHNSMERIFAAGSVPDRPTPMQHHAMEPAFARRPAGDACLA